MDAMQRLTAKPKKLQRTGAGQFLPTKCEECISGCNGMMTQHRCMHRSPFGPCYDYSVNDRFCGTAFCILCTEKRNCPETLMRCSITSRCRTTSSALTVNLKYLGIFYCRKEPNTYIQLYHRNTQNLMCILFNY